jgi:flagellar FliL protein
MADKEAAAPAAGAAPKKGKGKLIAIIGAVAVLVVGGGGAGAYLMLGKEGGDASAEKKAEPKKLPVFVDLDSFTVRLSDKEADRFMQVKLVAEVKDVASGETLKTMMPAVRNEILLLLASKASEELSSREAKEALAQEIVLAANKPLARTPGEGAVESVNFTHLIIQ